MLLDILQAGLQQFGAAAQKLPRKVVVPLPELGEKVPDHFLMLVAGFIGEIAQKPRHPGEG